MPRPKILIHLPRRLQTGLPNRDADAPWLRGDTACILCSSGLGTLVAIKVQWLANLAAHRVINSLTGCFHRHVFAHRVKNRRPHHRGRPGRADDGDMAGQVRRRRAHRRQARHQNLQRPGRRPAVPDARDLRLSGLRAPRVARVQPPAGDMPVESRRARPHPPERPHPRHDPRHQPIPAGGAAPGPHRAVSPRRRGGGGQRHPGREGRRAHQHRH